MTLRAAFTAASWAPVVTRAGRRGACLPGFLQGQRHLPSREWESDTGFSPSSGPSPPGSLFSVCFPGGGTVMGRLQPLVSAFVTAYDPPFFPWGLWACVCPPCLLAPRDISPSGLSRWFLSLPCEVTTQLGSHNPEVSSSSVPSGSAVLLNFPPKIFMFLGTRHRWKVRIRQSTQKRPTMVSGPAAFRAAPSWRLPLAQGFPSWWAASSVGGDG